MKKRKEKLTKIDQLFLDAQRKLESTNPSIKKMKEYLKKKGGSKKEIEEVITKLKKYSLLDEDEIIKNVLSYAETKHYGFNRIIQMLRLREIDPKKIVKLTKDEQRELRGSKEMTKRLIKRCKNKNTVNLKRSIFSALIRYGFDENIASIRAEEVYISPLEELNVLILDYKKAISSYSRKVDSSALKVKIRDSLIKKGYKINDIRKVEESNIYETSKRVCR